MQYYKIAGLVVQMDSFGRTVQQAEKYKINPCEHVDITIESLWQSRKDKFPMLSDSDGEYLATGADFYKKLLDHGGMMLHASAVVLDGRAYLFSADPGTGKSTHTNMWLNVFGDRAYILNDDKPAVRLHQNGWYAYGTPWSGKNDMSTNIGVPIAGIAMLHRGETNKVERWSGMEAIAAIMKQVNRPKALEYRLKLLELLDALVCQIPVWKLECNMDPDAVKVAYDAMSAEGSGED